MPPADSQQPKVTRHTRIVFEPGTSSSAVTETLRSLELPLAHKVRFALEYALGEVLFNALRTTAAKGVAKPVVADIVEDTDHLRVKVEDAAGGFDVGQLPYEFGSKINEVDVASEDFEQYRIRHNDRRYGLGLLTAQAMVEEFSLVFIDAYGLEVAWRGEGSVHGTRVQFRLPCEQAGRDKRRAPRHGMVGRALTDHRGVKARVRDLSKGGARLVFSAKPGPRLEEVYAMQIVLDDDEPLTADVKGKIVRVERVGRCYDVGVQFVDSDRKALARLERMLDRAEELAHSGDLQKVHVQLLSRTEG